MRTCPCFLALRREASLKPAVRAVGAPVVGGFLALRREASLKPPRDTTPARSRSGFLALRREASLKLGHPAQHGVPVVVSSRFGARPH